MKIMRGTTSKMMRVFIGNSTSTTGGGLTGLTYNSNGLTWYYFRDGDTSSTQVTLATASLGTWTSGGFKEVDATNMPGIYELGVPNAALDQGQEVIMYLQGASDMVPVPIEIELDAINYQDGTRGGMTALPNANAAASGGLPTVDSNNSVKVQSGTGANQINLSSGDVALQANQAVNASQIGGQNVVLDGNNLLKVDVADWGGSAVGGAPNSGDVTVGGYATNQDPYTLLMSAVNGVDTSVTLLQAMRLMLAVLCNKASISGSQVEFLRRDGSTVALTVTNDTSGNRSASTIGTV
jgi:hypothetical protein